MDDKNALDAILGHVCLHARIILKAWPVTVLPTAGCWMHLACRDPAAPPGRARLCFQSQEEVREFYAALQGQVVQVGSDHLAITVHNDLVDASILS